MTKENKNNGKYFLETIGDVIYWTFLIILTVVTISLVFQQIVYPERIPHVFGYKMFIILDDYMTDELQKGDLVITKNIPVEEYRVNDSMAFRNSANLVTIHKIEEITSIGEIKNFKMKALQNETYDTKMVQKDRIEGKLIKVIPFVGLILLYIQMPQVLIGIFASILAVGGIALWIARKLDARDRKRAELQQKASMSI